MLPSRYVSVSGLEQPGMRLGRPAPGWQRPSGSVAFGGRLAGVAPVAGGLEVPVVVAGVAVDVVHLGGGQGAAGEADLAAVAVSAEDATAAAFPVGWEPVVAVAVGPAAGHQRDVCGSGSHPGPSISAARTSLAMQAK